PGNGQPPQGVLEIGVESRRDEDELRLVLLENRRHDVRVYGGKDIVSRPGRKREIQGVTLSFLDPGLVEVAGARIVWILMRRDIQYLGIVVEGGLRPVAMVQIDIDDGYAQESIALTCVCRGEGNVVKQAEFHVLVRIGV